MTETIRDRAGPFALYPLRLGIALVFVLAGWGKFTAFGPWADAVASLGFPIPTVLAALVAVGELFGGIGIALGVLARFSAAVHAAIMATALVVVRILGDEPAGWRLDVALLAGSLTILVNGAGRPTVWSVLERYDLSIERRVRKAFRADPG